MEILVLNGSPRPNRNISALKGIRYPVGDRRFVCWYTNLKMC